MIKSTFYIENLGCAKNAADAEAMIASLESEGWKCLESPELARLIIINTCGFIEAARKESVDVTLGYRRRFPDKSIILGGCFSQQHGERLADLIPEVDGVFGNRAPARIDEILGDVLCQSRPVFLPEEYRFDSQRATRGSPAGSSYLKIAEGCDNRCSYCSIPLIRGGLRSRELDDVVKDAHRLLDEGLRELVLIAQDLGSYGLDRGSCQLPKLLKKILMMAGEYWIRLLYIHPDRFPSEILSICRDDSRLIPYFDVPVQHASRRIVGSMNRAGDSTAYLRLVDGIRSKVPDAVIRTTFLVGFPGETARDFAVLQDFQKRATFDWLGIFAFSREEGTRAYSQGLFPGAAHLLKKAIVKKRIDLIQETQQPITEGRLDGFIGRELPVLIEEDMKGDDLFLGRCYAHAPEVDALVVIHGHALPVGDFVRCRIVKRNGLDLEAVCLP